VLGSYVLFSTARDTLTLSTPYFVPDATVVEALCAAAHRGTRVTLIFPERNDSRFVAAASRSYYRRLLRAGCRIFEYQPGLLHAKTLTIDGVISLVGSTNLDLRSFDLNYENNILLESRDITSRIETHQKAFLADSVEIDLLAVMAWPAHRKILNNIAATVGPLL
jgi:cardiolipin synthase